MERLRNDFGMACKNCGVEKLSEEFPPSPLTPLCGHVSLHCLRCTNKKLKRFRRCPDCNVAVSQDICNDIEHLEAVVFWTESEKHEPLNKIKEGSSQIFVRQLDGSTTKIPFSSQLSVSDLKVSIEYYTSVPAPCQRLIYKGIQLEDSKDNTNRYISSYGLTANCTVYLISLFGSVFEEQVHFCIDVSFSMDNKFIIGNKLISRMECVKEELTKMITNFRPDKKFNLYAFGSRVINWSNSLQDCNPQNRQSALEWVKSLDPSGSTALWEALQAVIACDPDVKSIYVLSDGSPNSEHKVLDWIDAHPKVVINATCFLGNSILEEFMQIIATKTNGTYRKFSAEQLLK